MRLKNIKQRRQNRYGSIFCAGLYISFFNYWFTVALFRLTAKRLYSIHQFKTAVRETTTHVTKRFNSLTQNVPFRWRCLKENSAVFNKIRLYWNSRALTQSSSLYCLHRCVKNMFISFGSIGHEIVSFLLFTVLITSFFACCHYLIFVP